MWLLNRGSEVCRKVNGIRVGVLRRRWGYEKMSEEEVGVMRNAMTTRAPCGAKNTCLMKKLKAIWEPQKCCLTVVLGCFTLILSY